MTLNDLLHTPHIESTCHLPAGINTSCALRARCCREDDVDDPALRDRGSGMLLALEMVVDANVVTRCVQNNCLYDGNSV
jgi:hypothetical protein